MDIPLFPAYAPSLMAIPTNQQLLAALSHDLNKSGSSPAMHFVDEAARKTFTANIGGTLFEFAHKQPDTAYWNGVKHYSSGKQTKIRFPRTQPDPA
jgi:hypothetical protein